MGLVLLLPYATGWLGAGVVKLQLGIGAWIGAYYPVPENLVIVSGIMLLALLITGLMWVVVGLLRAPASWQELFPAGIPLAVSTIAWVVYLHI